jgi:hypothetical protein
MASYRLVKGTKCICLKEYDDETFRVGKFTVKQYLDDNYGYLKFDSNTEEYGTLGQICYITDVDDVNMMEDSVTYAVYFPELDLTDVFNLDQLDFHTYFQIVKPYVRLWREINES